MTEETPDAASGRIAIGIDVGGSGIKAAVVDVDAGRLRSERLRVPTPIPATPDAIIASITRLVRRLIKAGGLDEGTPIGVGLPGVAIGGVLKSAANIDPSWIDFPVVDRLTRLLKRPVYIINDADAAGIAEMRFGIGVGQPGVVIFLTLGTGVGSGVFNDGVLVPNTEFGQMEIRGRAAERRSAAVGPCPPWSVVEGLGGRPRRASRPHPAADVAEPDDPRRRGQQERGQVPPPAHGPLSRRRGHLAQRRGDHRRGDRRGRRDRRRRAAEGGGWDDPSRRRPRRQSFPHRRRRRAPTRARRPRLPDPPAASGGGGIIGARTRPQTHLTTPERPPDDDAHCTLCRAERGPHDHRRRDRGRGRRLDLRRRQPGDRSGHRDRAAGRERGRRSRGRGGAPRLRRPQGLGELGRRQARPLAGQARRR